MLRKIAELDRSFTLKTKGKISIVCAAAALLWVMLSKTFPMEFYSIFFASAVGSNILLILLAAVVSIPCNLLFSKLTENNISFIFSLISDIILMTAAAYAFSVFRYTMPLIFIISETLHFAAVIFLTGFPREEQNVKIPYIKRKPAAAVGLSAAHTVLSDGVFLFLMYFMARSFIS